MTAKDVRAGGAHVEIGIRDKLAVGLDKAAKRLRSFATMAAGIGAAVAGAGSAVLAPLIGATAKFLANGDAMSKLSDRTGASVESLSELSYAAEQSGATIDDLQSGFGSMAKMMLKGDEESKKTVATLERMGVSMAELDQLSPEERFTRLADAIADVQDPTEQAALAARVFGGAGQALLPMLKEGADGMEELRQRARDLGLVMSGEDAAAATTLGDLWSDLVKLAARLGDIIGGALAPVLIPLVDWFIGVASAVAKWTDANRPLIVTVAKIAAAVAGIGAVITGIAGAALGLSFVFTGLSAAVAGVGTVLGMAATVLGAIVSPAALAVAAVAAAAVAFVRFTAAGQTLWQGLQDTLGKAWAWTQEVFGGIAAAVQAGDFGLAAEIAWEAVKVAFSSGVAWVQDTFATLLLWLSGAATELGNGIIAGLSVAWDWIKSTAASVGDWIGGAFSGSAVSGPLSGLLAMFGDLWQGIAGGAAAIGDWLGGLWANFGLGASTAATTAGTYLATFWQSLVGWANESDSMLAGVWQSILATATATWNGLVTLWQSLVTTAAGIWQQLPGILFGIWTWIAESAAAVAAPVLSVFQGIVSGLVGYFSSISEALSGVFSWLGDMFSGLAAGAKETFGGIMDALSNGDWAGAANIAWLSIQLAWQTGVAEVSRVWNEFTTGLLIGLDSVVTAMRDRFAQFTGWFAKQLVKLWGLFDQELQVDAVIQTLEEDTQRKRDALTSDLDGRNSQRAADLSKQLAATEAKLAALREARQTALDAAATGKTDLLQADTNRLGDLLDKASQLAGAALDTAPVKPPMPAFDPEALAVAAVGSGANQSSGPIGTFNARTLSAFGPDRIDVDQLRAAQAAVEQLASMNRVLHLMSRNKAVYGA